MNPHHLHPTARRVFDTLPPSFQQAFRAHHHQDDHDELLEELALAALEGRTPAQARSAARRFMEGGQAPRRMASIDVVLEQGIEVADLMASHSQEEHQPALAGVPLDAHDIAKKHGVSRRRAQQLLKAQIARTRACGDLWLEAGEAPLEGEKPLQAGWLEQGWAEYPQRKINEPSLAGLRSGREGGV